MPRRACFCSIEWVIPYYGITDARSAISPLHSTPQMRSIPTCYAAKTLTNLFSIYLVRFVLWARTILIWSFAKILTSVNRCRWFLGLGGTRHGCFYPHFGRRCRLNIGVSCMEMTVSSSSFELLMYKCRGVVVVIDLLNEWNLHMVVWHNFFDPLGLSENTP